MEFLRWLESLRTPFWNLVFEKLTLLGEETVFMVIAIILHYLVQLITKALTPKPKADPPATEIVHAPGAEE